MPADRKSYEVLARRYRPQSFGDLVGQEPIATTLANAIRLGRVGHAYLFAGSRGVGKTSAARIFAKALNCAKGPTPEPCNECESCRLVSSGNDVDVIEIDGASNNGVDEVRGLRESAIYAAARSRFRIFIIDEVHMLTAAAFNALLKILEEPPSHVKFIFATTDPQKVIETVRSRCQRFDFRRIAPALVGERLQAIAANEGYAIEPAARDAVVRAAGGGLRDAQSLLDQLIAFAGDERTITGAMARDVLGVVPAETVAEIVRAIARGDASGALRVLDREIGLGRDPVDLLDHAIEHLRAALRSHVAGPDALRESDLDAADLALAEETKGLLSAEESLLAVQVLLETRRRLARAEGRVVLELAIVRLCRRPDVLSIGEALRAIRGEDPAAPGGPPDGSRPRAPAPPSAGGGAPRSHEPPSSPPDRPAPPPRPASPRRSEDAPPRATPEGPVRESEPEPEREEPPPGGTVFSPGPAPYVPAFERFLEEVRTRSRLLASCLAGAKLERREEGRIVIGLPRLKTFQRGQVDQPAHRKILEEAAAAAFAGGTRRVAVDLSLAVDEPAGGEPAAGPRPLADPILDRVIDLFDGKVVDVDRTGQRSD